MATHKLTEFGIRSAKPTDKTQKLADGYGLYLEVTPKGSKLWRFRYRYDGKFKLISLGIYPFVGLADARAALVECKRLLNQGIDPSAHRKAKKRAKYSKDPNRFEVVAREWFSQNESRWAEGHAKVTMQRLERDVFPKLGNVAVGEITAAQVLELLRGIEARHAIETAHRVKGIISQVLRYGIATNRLESDVTVGLAGALKTPVEKHLGAITDPKRLGEILKMINSYQGSFVVVCALKLTPLIFVRPGELRTMEWSQIDWEAQEWRFNLSKTKQPHIVPLSRQAIAILRDVQQLTGLGQYVFPSSRTPKRPMSNAAITAALKAMGISGDEQTAHGFRATARTLLDEVLKFRPDYVELQLGHTVRDPLGRAYNRTTHLAERREMMQAWADYLDKLKA